MDGISFPDPNRTPTPSLICTGRGTWKPLDGALPKKVTTIEEVIRSTYECIWMKVIQEARDDGQVFADIELGDPTTASGREFYEGCKKYLKDNRFNFEEAKIPAQGTTGARLIARITL